MDEGPPPFEPPPTIDGDDDIDFSRRRDNSAGDDHPAFDALKLPTHSRSPSPNRDPKPDTQRKANGVVHHDEMANGVKDDEPEPVAPLTVELPRLEIHSPTLHSSPSPAREAAGGGGIESFLEREEIHRDALPPGAIGLSPAHSRDPSPAPQPSPLVCLPAAAQSPAPSPAPSPMPAMSPAPEGDDWDDFGDFGSAPPAMEKEDAVSDKTLPASEEAEWSTFGSSCAPVTGEEAEADDDWAAFSAAPSTAANAVATPRQSGEEAKDDNDDWAADFASATPPPRAAPVEIVSLPALSTLAVDEGVWGCDEEEDKEHSDGEGAAFDLHACLDATDPVGQVPRRSDDRDDVEGSMRLSASLWLALRIVEEASALKHEWAGSEAASRIFALLGIDPTASTRGQLILSPDTVLKPTPIGEVASAASTANGKTTRTVTLSTTSSSISRGSSSPSSSTTSTTQPPLQPTPALQPTTAAPQRVSPVPSESLLTGGPFHVSALPIASSKRDAVIDSLAAPPAEFDWESSGLKNSLTPQAVSASSAILDIDFLAGVNGEPPLMVSSDATLQKELERAGLSTTSASAGLSKISSGPSMLDTLMASTMSSSSSSAAFLKPSELSLDARALHDALPDISYLSNAWITIPVKQRPAAE